MWSLLRSSVSAPLLLTVLASPVAGQHVGEVFRHMAADNYAIPALLGVEPPASTGIKVNDYSSIQGYESRTSDRAMLLKELAESFTHLKKAIAYARSNGIVPPWSRTPG